MASETFGLSVFEGIRDTRLTTASDDAALLAIDELEDGPIYYIPHQVTATNNFDQEVTVTLGADSNSVSIDSAEFDLPVAGSETISIDDSDLTCNESDDTTISVDAGLRRTSRWISSDRSPSRTNRHVSRRTRPAT